MSNKKEVYIKTKEAYNQIAGFYANKYESYKLVKSLLDQFLKKIPQKGLILDVGCGHGRDSFYFYQKGYNVLGFDNSIELLKIAQNIAPEIPFLEFSLPKLNIFLDNSFDGIWANAVLHHLPDEDLSEAFSQLFRVLKPGGQIFISVRNKEKSNWDCKYDGVSRYFNYFDKEKMKSLLKDSGLTLNRFRRNEDEESWLHTYATK